MLAGTVTITYIEEYNTCVFAQYTIQVTHRPKVQVKLKAIGIPTAVQCPIPLHLQSAFSSPGHGENSFPVAEAAIERVLSLPMSPYLIVTHLNRIAEAIKDFVV
jgi:UDP-2-acetamido-2-deoxy-ribo-hexuluronate aminotransferase